MRHILLISGKDSLATALVQTRRQPNLPYEMVFNDTGWDLPETLEWIDRVGVYFGMPIIHCGDDLTEICREQKVLPQPKRRFCTKYAKIKPLKDFLGKSPAVLYFGLRADEAERVGYDPPPRQICCYPLREHGLGIKQVWDLCASVDLLPPAFHWQWMEDRVRRLLGRLHTKWLDILLPWERQVLFAWRGRNNCDRCFYSRLYEKIGLWEHYPERYEAACLLEEELGHNDFTWNQGYSLRQLPKQAYRIKSRRAHDIVAWLWKHNSPRKSSFFEIVQPDDLNVTSCGLLCGK